MTTPDDSYPDNWKPAYVREREHEQRLFDDFSEAVAKLSDADIEAIRKDHR